MTIYPKPRSIIHVDLDAFFCSVEELLEPAIRGKAIIVGADPHGRGVVAAASYEARRYGVHSAMPIGQAARLCPDGVFLRPRHGLYSEYSHKVMTLLEEYTPLVEQVSIDEAFMDVTGSQLLFGSAEDIGHAIQRRILDELGLPCTVGIAANKLVAKVASELGKPRGLVVVASGDEAEFLAPLPVERLWGVGPKTAQRLHAQGVRAIGELAALRPQLLRAQFGKMGEYLHQRASGIDQSPVEPSHERKSVSQDHTFEKDTAEPSVVEAKLLELSEGVARQLRQESWRARTITLRLRYANFHTITRSRTLSQPTDLGDTLYKVGLELLRHEWSGQPLVRLVGIGASNLVAATTAPVGLFDQEQEKRRKLDRTVDRLRERFGDNALRRGGIPR